MQEAVQREQDGQEQDGSVSLEFTAATASQTRLWMTTAALTGAGIAGRAAFQAFPSVEPLLPVAIAAGFFGGWRHGAVSGGGGFFLSNFLVWGGQGPWTVFQVIGAAAGGMAGAFLGRVGGRRAFLAAMVVGTVAYEAVINLGSLLFMPGIALVAAAPFVASHIASSIGFGAVLYGMRELVEERYDDIRLAVRRVRHRGDRNSDTAAAGRDANHHDGTGDSNGHGR